MSRIFFLGRSLGAMCGFPVRIFGLPGPSVVATKTSFTISCGHRIVRYMLSAFFIRGKECCKSTLMSATLGVPERHNNFHFCFICNPTFPTSLFLSLPTMPDEDVFFFAVLTSWICLGVLSVHDSLSFF